MAWTAAQKAWLKKNDPAKLARGYANRKKGPSLSAKKPPPKKPAGGGYRPPAAKPKGGGGGLQWNANEKAWAKKHGVNLGQKTAGGLSTNAAYRQKMGLGGKPAGGGGLQMQPVGGGGGQKTLYGRTYVSKGGGGQGGGGGQPGGGLIKGRPGGPQAAFGAGAPTMKKGMKGGLLGGALGGAAGFYGSQAAAAYGGGKTGAVLSGFGKGASSLFGAGKMGAVMGGPVGWGIAGGLLGASLLANKKTNQQFEGTIDTGGAKGFKQGGGQLAQIKEGYVPTKEEFTQHGRWLMPEDSYAHDYGRTFEGKDAQYYDAFQKQAQGFLKQAQGAKKGSREYNVAMGHYKNVMKSHGFETPKAPPPPPKPKARSAPAPAPEAPPAAAPPPPKREEVSPPAKGLEETVVAPPDMIEKEEIEKPGLEPVPEAPKPEDVLQPDQIDELAERRKKRGLLFTDYKKKRRAGFFSYARPSRVRMA